MRVGRRKGRRREARGGQRPLLPLRGGHASLGCGLVDAGFSRAAEPSRFEMGEAPAGVSSTARGEMFLKIQNSLGYLKKNFY